MPNGRWEFETPQVDPSNITSIFAYSKNRQGQPTKHLSIRLDDPTFHAVEVFVQSRVDPRINTYSALARDAIVNWLGAAVKVHGVEDTPTGILITKLLIDEELNNLKQEQEEDSEFLIGIRTSTEKAVTEGNRGLFEKLRLVAFRRANRTDNPDFTRQVQAIFSRYTDDFRTDA